ncbi:hypothetical protein HOLleu_09745 [Holothuria leucospilota]|uniref:Uncharacterized protein n=1 Tax=Holothuria leucospilota TaxID=206669 RepID=A0A9Q1HF69_HOLLE|nr:hypothetical protein HOLleu_09745 [Holothuria leucospilota]
MDVEEYNKIQRYLWNGNKAKIISTGFLNTSALTSNASLLAIIIRQDALNVTAKISITLIGVSVLLQILIGIISALEYKASVTCERNVKNLAGKRKGLSLKMSEEDGTSHFCFLKPMEYQFILIMCTMFLTVINVFIVALSGNLEQADRFADNLDNNSTL